MTSGHWSTVELLNEAHDRAGFTCGDDGMDGWFHESALREHTRQSCRVHVCMHEQDGIQGFFALSSHEVRKAYFPSDSGGLTSIPSILLGRLGRHSRLASHKVGGALVMEALGVAVTAASTVGSRLLIVDAKSDGLVDWYQKLGFKKSRLDGQRLSMKMVTAQVLVEQYKNQEDSTGPERV